MIAEDPNLTLVKVSSLLTAKSLLDKFRNRMGHPSLIRQPEA